jgi:hypothetical protein
MSRYLILETYPYRPHLETSCEIALNLKKYGNDVYFCWLGDHLLWAEWHLNFFQKILGCSYKKRIKNIIELLRFESIKILSCNDFLDFNKESILNWSKNFNGTIEDLKKYKYLNKYNLGISVASTLISFFHNTKFDTVKKSKLVEKCLFSSALIYEISNKIISKINPDFLITYNGRFFASRPIVISGLNNKIKVL